MRPLLARNSDRALLTGEALGPLGSRLTASLARHLALDAGRASLAAEADHGLAVLAPDPQRHDATWRMIGQAKEEASIAGDRSLVGIIQNHNGLARSSDSAPHPQLPCGDHGLVDDDVGDGWSGTQRYP